MVVGGWPASESYKVEVVDLSGQNQSCSDVSIRDAPIDYGSVGVFIQNKPMICGGYNIEYGTNDCYTYEKVISISTSQTSLISYLIKLRTALGFSIQE